MVEPRGTPELRWLTAPDMVDPATRSRLLACWRDVSNAGGAVGFPFLPVSDENVRPALEAMVQSLDPRLNRLLIVTIGEVLAGWLLLAGNESELTAHWARVLRVQTALEYRGRGIGRLMMAEVARAARHEFGLEQLHLELRAGLGLESFYRNCGWSVVGTWPGALRMNEHDYRDEVLMLLSVR